MGEVIDMKIKQTRDEAGNVIEIAEIDNSNASLIQTEADVDIPVRVFVYGTLKKNHSNYYGRLDGEGTKFLGPSHIEGYVMRDMGAYPAAIPFPNSKWRIYGEVYMTTYKTMKEKLDPLEGHPNFYKRELVSTIFGQAWVYTLPKSTYLLPGAHFIPSGKWEYDERRYMWPTGSDSDRTGVTSILCAMRDGGAMQWVSAPYQPHIIPPYAKATPPPSPPKKRERNPDYPWYCNTKEEGDFKGPDFEDVG